MARTHYAAVLLNTDTEAFSRGYIGADILAYDARCLLDLQAPSLEDALELAFAIGNRMGTDATGKSWSPNVRSISVGDVIRTLTAEADDEGEILTVGFYAVDRIGFTELQFPPRTEYGMLAMMDGGVARN